MREAVRDWVGVKVEGETKGRVVGEGKFLCGYRGIDWGFERVLERRRMVVVAFMAWNF